MPIQKLLFADFSKLEGRDSNLGGGVPSLPCRVAKKVIHGVEFQNQKKLSYTRIFVKNLCLIENPRNIRFALDPS